MRVSALQQCRAEGTKVLFINVTHAIQSSACDVSAVPFLVAQPPTPAWVEKNLFVSQLCGPPLPSIPAQGLYKAPGVFWQCSGFHTGPTRNTQVPALGLLYARAMEWERDGLSTTDILQMGEPSTCCATLPLQRLHLIQQNSSNKRADVTQAEGDSWLDQPAK